MLLWIDNEIAPPNNNWIWVGSIDEAYSVVKDSKRELKLVHINLGLKNKTEFIKWCENIQTKRKILSTLCELQ